ncbi:uncharacterized protein NECHADRAFT_81884 [Fusarium vanettenii 77-13-4]|uniref:BHLH domain-containing protein n=1 Tax=Fusarium vanettenii (strain ATCC MYA-4622 / CBS 123669 / FGSC 9596 / NRRL 45880 / 77-13-4) TaxID=660122 RepID=C7Z9V5_FUSV7|nr:uncharacterized protein NECHADRAFT_81884 [Fusarium vanettenii 77-13-4]EEU39167.1 hypothetical protein NECHADRAFT_81884 [Fusarium vanettenii 77-13-4]
MAGEHSGDQSFYDFLIEEPERHPVIFSINSPFRRRIDPAAIRRSGQTRPRSRPTIQPITRYSGCNYRIHHVRNHAGTFTSTYTVLRLLLQLNPPQFDFPGAMIPAGDGTIGHQNHLSHASTDPAFAYGSELVSPSSIHSSRGHYDGTVSNHWDDALSHGASTPKVTTPAAHVTTNPWAEVDEVQEDNHPAPSSRPRRTPRPRRQKKDARKTSEASQGGSSSAGGAPSVSDAASPSSTSQNSRASVGSKSASMASTTSTASSRQSKLRSASRTSKNSRDKPNDTPEERRTRASHNLVEKQYRNRLNAQFESLLSALPEQARSGGSGGGNGNGDENESDAANDADRRVSKGEVLEMARKHIEALEQERNQLERENLELQGSLRRLKGSTSDGTTSSSGQQTPLDFNSNTDQDKVRDDRDED